MIFQYLQTVSLKIYFPSFISYICLINILFRFIITSYSIYSGGLLDNIFTRYDSDCRIIDSMRKCLKYYYNLWSKNLFSCTKKICLTYWKTQLNIQYILWIHPNVFTSTNWPLVSNLLKASVDSTVEIKEFEIRRCYMLFHSIKLRWYLRMNNKRMSKLKRLKSDLHGLVDWFFCVKINGSNVSAYIDHIDIMGECSCNYLLWPTAPSGFDNQSYLIIIN